MLNEIDVDCGSSKDRAGESSNELDARKGISIAPVIKRLDPKCASESNLANQPEAQVIR
jgi:hypothetical protein